jgi:hypothetical protein
MRIEMTRRVQMPPLGSEFDDFLYAPIGEDSNETPLSVLSALARLDVDPWEEAAQLAQLPEDTAARKLVSLIAALPKGSSACPDPATIAPRLIALLPCRPGSRILPRKKKLSGVTGAMPHAPVKAYLMYYAVVIATVLISQWLFPSRPASTKVDSAPVSESGAASPQTPRPSSRQ